MIYMQLMYILSLKYFSIKNPHKKPFINFSMLSDVKENKLSLFIIYQYSLLALK